MREVGYRLDKVALLLIGDAQVCPFLHGVPRIILNLRYFLPNAVSNKRVLAFALSAFVAQL